MHETNAASINRSRPLDLAQLAKAAQEAPDSASAVVAFPPADKGTSGVWDVAVLDANGRETGREAFICSPSPKAGLRAITDHLAGMGLIRRGGWVSVTGDSPPLSYSALLRTQA